MRITKKFSGAACLGNKVFFPRLNQPAAQRPQAVARAREELRILEGRLVDACVPKPRGNHQGRSASTGNLDARRAEAESMRLVQF